jgi:hypothetical protein
VNMYSDWGTTNALCEALSSAALSAPDTPLAFTLVATGPNATTTVSGSVFPEIPPMSGEGPNASSISFTLTGSRNVTPTIVAA